MVNKGRRWFFMSMMWQRVCALLLTVLIIEAPNLIDTFYSGQRAGSVASVSIKAVPKKVSSDKLFLASAPFFLELWKCTENRQRCFRR